MSFRKRISSALIKAGRWLATGFSTPNYNSTGSGIATKTWDATSSAINTLLAGSGDTLVRQARDLERRNSFAKNAVNVYVANIVGTGIVPTFKHPDQAVRATLQSAWNKWVKQCDADGRSDFYGLQTLGVRTEYLSGEFLIRFRNRRVSDGLVVPLQIQMLEPEHLPFTGYDIVYSPFSGNLVRWGIEFNKIGQRVAYWLYPFHPGETTINTNTYEANIPKRIPASEVLHVFLPGRPGQQRGETRFVSVMLALYELEKYDRAELVRKSLAAMMAFFERDMEGNQTEILGTEEDEDGNPITGVEPGSYVRLPQGKDITVAEPSDVGGMYPDFMRVQLRKIAAGCGITYEMLTGDLTGVNYSSIRAGLLEFRRRAEAYQHQVVVFQFCDPVMKRFLDAAAMVGVIDANDYVANPDLYTDIEWQPPAWSWVDPLKDAQAEVLLIDNLLKARSQSIKQQGYDPEAVDEMILQDQQRETSKGLIRHATVKNAAQAVDGQSGAQNTNGAQQQNGGEDAAGND